MNSSKIKNKKKTDYNIICKLIGERNHEYIIIENEKTLIIQKSKENCGKIMTTKWSFEMNRIYEENINFEEIFENEIICSDYYTNILNGQKGCFIFISNVGDTLIDGTDSPANFMKNNLKEIFNILNNTSYMKQANIFITISYIDIYENKYKDNFNFDNNIKIPIKINEYEDEICIDGLKEIQIIKLEQFESLIKFVADRRMKMKISEKDTQFSELFTIKLYKKNKENILLSKFNFLLYKGYSISKREFKEYTINTKENYNFFNTLKDPSLRLCKVVRMIKDTFENNNIFFILPIKLEYIILIHDMLNYGVERKSEFITESINNDKPEKSKKEKDNSIKSGYSENVLINDFKNLKINKSEDNEDKENDYNIVNKSSINNRINHLQSLNLDRLKKIENKSNVKILFDKLEN